MIENVSSKLLDHQALMALIFADDKALMVKTARVIKYSPRSKMTVCPSYSQNMTKFKAIGISDSETHPKTTGDTPQNSNASTRSKKPKVEKKVINKI